MAVHVGIGGWTFAPWRGVFYPAGLPHARELGYASRQLTSIEINGTFYGSQKPASFARWHDETPEDFVFSLKGPRFATHRRDLAASGESITRFLESGVLELKDKLGPMLWQFPATRAFEPAAFESFLAQLPPEHGGRKLRHVIEARHPSFNDAAYFALLRKHAVAHVMLERDEHDLFADVTAPFVYARLQHNSAAAEEGYDSAALDGWAARVGRWTGGKRVTDLPLAAPAAKAAKLDCFVYFISGEKVCAPAAATAMLRRLGFVPPPQ